MKTRTNQTGSPGTDRSKSELKKTERDISLMKKKTVDRLLEDIRHAENIYKRAGTDRMKVIIKDPKGKVIGNNTVRKSNIGEHIYVYGRCFILSLKYDSKTGSMIIRQAASTSKKKGGSNK